MVFVILMIGMLVVGYFRFQEPPAGVEVPGMGFSECEALSAECEETAPHLARHA